MKPKMFGSGAAALKFGAGKPSGKKAMPGSRRMLGGGSAREARGEAIDYMPPVRAPGNSDDPQIEATDYMRHYPRISDDPQIEATDYMRHYPGISDGGPGGPGGRGKIVKKMASGGKVKKMAAGSLATAPPKPSPDDEQNRFVPNARKKLLDAQKRQALLGMPEGLKHGGKVTKPWEGSKADMAQDRKLADKQNLSMDKLEKSAMDRKMDAKGLNYGGKVKKMAGGGPSGEMQAFMKGRRDARGSMAPRAAMMPKASMASMAPKARMMSKAPMVPMASMLGMKSGGAARGNSRGNGCAVKGHTRGRMA